METESQPAPLPVPAFWRGRFLYVLLTIVLPIACFVASPALRPEWQSGRTSDYAALLLDPQAAVFFFPFLLYAMVCMALLLGKPEHYAQQFTIRFGIYSGVFLAFQYLIILAIALETAAWIADSVFFGLLLLYFWVKTKFGQRGLQVFGWLVLTGGIFLFAFSILERFSWNTMGPEIFINNLWGTLSSLPFFLLVIVMILAPCFCLTLMTITAFKLFKTHETNLLLPWARSLGWLVWLGGMLAAWRFSVLEMLKIYASLPPSPPDCYIATAAARGHRPIVQAQPVALPTGLLWVNSQLQYLKCTELALMTLSPHLHRPLRISYDLIGKALARILTNPFLADLAYLTLKPLEWLARLVLKTIVPEIDQYARKLYSESDRTKTQ